MFQEMQLWIQQIIKSMNLTDYRIGTVIQLNPIKIDFGDNKIITDVGTNIFYTEQVIEKKIVLGHKHTLSNLIHAHTLDNVSHEHTYSGSSTGQSLTDTYSTSEDLNGDYDTSEDLKTFIINEGIKKDDKLLMLRVADGQKFIVLSKIRNTNSIIIS